MSEAIKKPLTINDLNDDCLKLIFNYLAIQEKLLIECVCVRWQQLVIQLLNTQQVIKIGLKSSFRNYYSCNDVNYFIHNCSALRHNNDWINASSITNDNLSAIVIRCPNIEYLYVCDCYISVSTLEWIISQMRRLTCISLLSINGITIGDWVRVCDALSQRKLKHFALSDNHFAQFDISRAIEYWPTLTQLSLAYYRSSLTDIFAQISVTLTKLTLIECFRTNLVSMKSLVTGNGANVTKLIVHKVPTYDENTLCEFICLKMSHLMLFSYAFDSQVPYIEPIQYLRSVEHLSILSNEEYGIHISSLYTRSRILSNVKYLRLNSHLDSRMIHNLELLFPNVEKLELSFDRICCDCAERSNALLNNNNAINNQNNNQINNDNNNNNDNINNNNNEQNNALLDNNNFVDDNDEDEPYLDDNCLACSEKFILIISRLEKLRSLALNGERIKDSAVKSLPFCCRLNSIIIDNNCAELNLRLLIMTCVEMAKSNRDQWLTLKFGEKYYSRIINIKNMPQNLVILKHA